MNEKLTPAEREAVRAYLRYLFAVPGLIAVLLAGAGGFFFQEIVYERAYKNAYIKAFPLVQTQLVNSTQKLANAESEMRGLLKQMQAQTKEGEELRQKLENTTNFSLASEQVGTFVEEIHKRVVGDETFLENIDKVIRTPNASDLNDRIRLECNWLDVGREKSHYPDKGDWCPANEFISQFDLNLGGGAHVIAARCCKVTFE